MASEIRLGRARARRKDYGRGLRAQASAAIQHRGPRGRSRVGTRTRWKRHRGRPAAQTRRGTGPEAPCARGCERGRLCPQAEISSALGAHPCVSHNARVGMLRQASQPCVVILDGGGRAPCRAAMWSKSASQTLKRATHQRISFCSQANSLQWVTHRARDGNRMEITACPLQCKESLSLLTGSPSVALRSGKGISRITLSARKAPAQCLSHQREPCSQQCRLWSAAGWNLDALPILSPG